MKKALKLNKPGFVRVLIENGVQISNLFKTNKGLYCKEEGFYNFNKYKVKNIKLMIN
jgi:hypothetical protein